MNTATTSCLAVASRLRSRLLPVGGLVLLLIVLAGCGFHLRTSFSIPQSYNPIFIQAGGGSPVRKAITDMLTGSNIRVTNDINEAKLIVRLLGETRDSRVAAVDENAKTLAYELHYVVTYDALDAAQKQLVPAQSMDLVRTFDNPDVEVLGKELEEEQIYNDFAIDAADRILMRLSAVLEHSAGTPATPPAPANPPADSR